MKTLLAILCLWPALIWADQFSSAVLADSPVNYWRLNETSGTSAADLGSSPVTGTYNGSPTLNQAAIGPGATSGASVNFNTSSKYVDFPSAVNAPFNPNVANGAGWTAGVWAGNMDNSGTRFLMGRYKGASNYSWQFFTDTAPKVFANVYKVCAGNTGANVINGTTIATGMHQLMLTTVGDGTGIGTMTFYQDGVSKGTATSITVCTANSNSLRLALDGDGSFTPNQNLAEAMIFTTALSGTRVLAQYNAAFAAPSDPSWPFITRRPELPRFRDPDYLDRFIAGGYNTGLFAASVVRPRYLNMGYLPFNIVPNGRIRGH